MTLQTLINALLTGYAPVARPIAIVTTAALLLPVFYIIARGQAIQRTAAGRGRRRWAILWAVLLFLVSPIVMISWVAIGGRAFVIDRGGILDEKVATRLALLIGVGTLVLWGFMRWLTRPGSWLSETLNLLMGGVRRRTDELGRAHFADRLEYKRFAQKQPNGVTLLGEFRGDEFKPNQYRILGHVFSLSAEDAARGIITIGNPGSGKSQSIILPIIADSMKDGECLVITDPQGELKHQVRDFARVTGHVVIVHDPTDANCPRFNRSKVSAVSRMRGHWPRYFCPHQGAMIFGRDRRGHCWPRA